MEPSAEGRSPIIKPVATLPRWALLGIFVAIIGVGLGVYSMFPEVIGGPPLPIEVSIETAIVPAVGGGVLPSPVIAVTNTADFPIPHLAVIINGHYQIERESPIEAGQRLDLPQSIFTDKRSSRRFNPTLQKIEKVVVRGQLPAGTRGVSVFEFDQK